MTNNDHDRAIATWLERTRSTAQSLGSQWDDLGGMIAPARSGGDCTGIRGTTVHAAAPIRVEVVSLRDDIAATARRYAELVNGTLRMGIRNNARGTRERLHFIGNTLPRLHASDPVLCDEVADALWDHHRAASKFLDGPGRPRARRIPDPCPECGYESLWVDPSRWLIACGMDDCDAVWGVNQPVLRHVSE